MKNYRTTIVGLALAVALALDPLVSAGEMDYQKLLWAAFVAVFGYLAKDAGVTGTEK